MPAWAQAGKNGAATITAPNTILNEYAALVADASLGSSSISINSTGTTPTLLNTNSRFSSGLQVGDLLLVYQPQGATMNTAEGSGYGSISTLGSAGRYQLVQVAGVPTTVVSGANTITLSCMLYASFTTAGHAQVVRVPRYTSLTLNPSAAGTAAAPTVTAQAWDGSTGGVVTAEVQGNVVLANGATIDVSGRGFRGGVVKQTTDDSNNLNYAYASASNKYGGAKGESIVGYTTEYAALTGTYGRGAPANGGGGGNSHNGGGGGGANAAAAATTYTGTGNPAAGYDAIWNLESSGFASSTSSGGGRGGYSYASVNQSPATYGPDLDSWGGDRRRVKGGLGGHPVSAAGRAFFGGGGGAGDSNDGTGTSGAAGGGFVYLVSGGTVGGSGSLLANGGSPAGYNSTTTGTRNDGPGGAGGGGSIVVQAANSTNALSLRALGGTGGSQIYPNTTNSESEGPGGGGGGGYIAYLPGTGTAPTASVTGGTSGTSNAAPVVSAFPVNGATKGGDGLIEATSASCTSTSLAALNSLNNTSCAAVADVSTTVSFSSNPQPVNRPVTITAAFRNAGPNDAANVVRTVQLPQRLTGVTVTTSQGSGNYDAPSGIVSFTSVGALASGSTLADATITYTPAQTGSVTVSSTISTSTNEACQADNNASGNATLVIQPVADLKLVLTANTSGVVINAATANTITYTTAITNQTTSADPSGAAATGVALTVQLPKALLNPVLPSGASYSPTTGVLTLSVGTINLSTTVSYSFTFTLSPNNQRTDTNGAQVVAIASASANELDNTPADNTNQQLAIPVSLLAGNCTGTGFDGNPATQGLYGEYYKGYFADDLTYFNAKTATIARTDGRASYATTNGWGDVTAASNGGTASNPDYFSARLRGYLTITTGGNYTFRTSSDDASYVWVGAAARAATLDASQAVVKDGGAHGTRNTDGTAVALAAGTYPILILYGENAGDNALTISYSGPDTNNAMAVIPQTALCTQAYTTTSTTTTSTPLPVTLVGFTAVADGSQAARLRWATASELRSSHFEVERSHDGVAFSRLGSVAAAGTTLVAHTYTFVDALAAPVVGGTAYYRLRQVDTDGTAVYSPVQTVGFAAGSSVGLVCYPNPARTSATLNLGALATGTGGQLAIRDVLGRLVRTLDLPATDTQLLLADLQTLPAGVYQMQAQRGGQRLSGRLLVQAAAQ